jgi:hypothetical protein
MTDKTFNDPENWQGRVAAITDAAALLIAGEPVMMQRMILARLLAVWAEQFPPLSRDNVDDLTIETRDGAMSRLLVDLHHAEAQRAREKWRESLQ